MNKLVVRSIHLAVSLVPIETQGITKALPLDCIRTQLNFYPGFVYFHKFFMYSSFLASSLNETDI